MRVPRWRADSTSRRGDRCRSPGTFLVCGHSPGIGRPGRCLNNDERCRLRNRAKPLRPGSSPSAVGPREKGGAARRVCEQPSGRYMTDQITGVLRRYGRFLWGGAALLLLLVLLGSVVLSGSSVGGAEADAQARAERLSGSVIEEVLNPDLLVRDITGAAARDLTVLVRAVTLSDDRFTTVRIWRLDGGLIFSTAERDDPSVMAADNRWIGQALDGKTVSALSSAGTYHDGLQRPDEDLFQTFVPITLSDDGTVDGVVQIDQRYSPIHDPAYGTRRPLQLVVFLLLIGVGVMFVRSQRRAHDNLEDGPPERRQGHGRRAEDVDVLARAERAERATRETEGRLLELESALAAAPTTAEIE